MVETTSSFQLSFTRTTGTPGSPDSQACFRQRDDPSQMRANNTVESVLGLKPDAGREPMEDDSKGEGKATSLACTKLAVTLRTVYNKGKEQSVLEAIFNRQLN